jgi:hypothetical protein
MAWSLPPQLPPLTPVTISCLLDAVYSQQVPLAAFVGIMAAENGQVSQVIVNRNGTYDIGPLQINSSWLGSLARHGISEVVVRNNGCVNVMAGAWIFRQVLVETKGDVWGAIGRYHSGRGSLALTYQRRVYRHLSSPLWLEDVVARANRSLGAARGVRMGWGQELRTGQRVLASGVGPRLGLAGGCGVTPGAEPGSGPALGPSGGQGAGSALRSEMRLWFGVARGLWLGLWWG